MLHENTHDPRREILARHSEPRRSDDKVMSVNHAAQHLLL